MQRSRQFGEQHSAWSPGGRPALRAQHALPAAGAHLLPPLGACQAELVWPIGGSAPPQPWARHAICGILHQQYQRMRTQPIPYTLYGWKIVHCMRTRALCPQLPRNRRSNIPKQKLPATSVRLSFSRCMHAAVPAAQIREQRKLREPPSTSLPLLSFKLRLDDNSVLEAGDRRRTNTLDPESFLEADDAPYALDPISIRIGADGAP